MSTQQKENEVVDEWVQTPHEVMDEAGIEENTEIVATGKPRAGFWSHRDNEAHSADVLLRNVLHQFEDEANVVAYNESEGPARVERKEGEPKWKFPSARKGRNTNMTVVYAEDPSKVEMATRDPEVHVFADTTTWTGHELGHENRQSDEPYGRIDEVLDTDLGADIGIATIKSLPFFNDIASDQRDEADFDEYVSKVADQVDDLYESSTVIGEDRSYGAQETGVERTPNTVYVMGEDRL